MLGLRKFSLITALHSFYDGGQHYLFLLICHHGSTDSHEELGVFRENHIFFWQLQCLDKTLS